MPWREYLIFLNNDTQIQKGWLTSLLIYDTTNLVGAVGSKLLYPDTPSRKRVELFGGTAQVAITERARIIMNHNSIL